MIVLCVSACSSTLVTVMPHSELRNLMPFSALQAIVPNGSELRERCDDTLAPAPTQTLNVLCSLGDWKAYVCIVLAHSLSYCTCLRHASHLSMRLRMRPHVVYCEATQCIDKLRMPPSCHLPEHSSPLATHVEYCDATQCLEKASMPPSCYVLVNKSPHATPRQLL